MDKLGRHRGSGWDMSTCHEVPVQRYGDAKYITLDGRAYTGKGRSIPLGRGYVYVCQFRGEPAVLLANDSALRLKRSKLK